jgi:hypothetical protein
LDIRGYRHFVQLHNDVDFALRVLSTILL